MTLRPSSCPYLPDVGEGVFSEARVALLARVQSLREASLLHEPLPIDLFVFSLAHSWTQTFTTFSGTRLAGLGTTSTLKPMPFLSPSLSPSLLDGLQPKRCLKRESSLRADSSSSLSPSWLGTLALCALAFTTNPLVSTSTWRFLPRTFLPLWYLLCSPPTPGAFAGRELSIPALGSGFLPERARSRSRSAALSPSKDSIHAPLLNYG